MQDKLKFYIDGKWVDPVTPKTLEVINPANEEPFARISLGSKADVDKAVAAARRAFETFSRTMAVAPWIVSNSKSFSTFAAWLTWAMPIAACAFFERPSGAPISMLIA